jgi:hypothetical protein
MRKIKEVLRLHFEAGLSAGQIAKICELGKGTVRRFLTRAEGAGFWSANSAASEALSRPRVSAACRRDHARSSSPNKSRWRTVSRPSSPIC